MGWIGTRHGKVLYRMFSRPVTTMVSATLLVVCQMFKSTQMVHINFHAQTHQSCAIVQAVLELAVRARTPNTLRMKIWGCTWVSLRTVARRRMKYARRVANAMRMAT